MPKSKNRKGHAKKSKNRSKQIKNIENKYQKTMLELFKQNQMISKKEALSEAVAVDENMPDTSIKDVNLPEVLNEKETIMEQLDVDLDVNLDDVK